MKTQAGLKVRFPPFDEEKTRTAGIKVRKTRAPYSLLDGAILFMGQIPMKTDFEKGVPYLFCEQEGEETRDPIDDDSAIIAHVKGKGLAILSGCAHAGIINTINYAQELTGIDKIFIVMGGFHLSGPDFEAIIDPTTQALKDINPRYIVPTHCTGRKAIMYIEQEMPEKFLLNMSGTKLIFSA
jgi:7,8-dihydropterin-6-yl-methyl-4-(beta-D-ribofuranosyl)aminobenzene 5'-phosphate synthase